VRLRTFEWKTTVLRKCLLKITHRCEDSGIRTCDAEEATVCKSLDSCVEEGGRGSVGVEVNDLVEPLLHVPIPTEGSSFVHQCTCIASGWMDDVRYIVVFDVEFYRAGCRRRQVVCSNVGCCRYFFGIAKGSKTGCGKSVDDAERWRFRCRCSGSYRKVSALRL